LLTRSSCHASLKGESTSEHRLGFNKMGWSGKGVPDHPRGRPFRRVLGPLRANDATVRLFGRLERVELSVGLREPLGPPGGAVDVESLLAATRTTTRGRQCRRRATRGSRGRSCRPPPRTTCSGCRGPPEVVALARKGRQEVRPRLARAVLARVDERPARRAVRVGRNAADTLLLLEPTLLARLRCSSFFIFLAGLTWLSRSRRRFVYADSTASSSPAQSASGCR